MNDLPLNSKKLLAINFGGIGDEVLFLPVLKTIKENSPKTHITLLLEPRSRSIKELSQEIDQIITFDIKKRPLLISDLLELLTILKSGNYQTVVSSGSSPLVSILLFLSGIQKRVGYYSGKLSSKLLTNVVPLKREQYAADMYHDLVQGLDLAPKSTTPSISVPKESLKKMNEFLKQSHSDKSKTRIVVHPGTSLLAIQKGIIKTWDAANWASLIKKLAAQPNIQVILAGGPDDAITINKIIEKLGTAGDIMSNFMPAYGATRNLGDLAALVQLSNLLVCVDSAPMHIAVGLDKPLVALFGPTDYRKLLPSKDIFKALSAPKVQIDPDTVYKTILSAIHKDSQMLV